MVRAQPDVFGHALNEAHEWLNDLMQELRTDDRRRAWAALRGVLHALRDRIGAHNAAHLGDQLPLLVRGLFFEAWHIAEGPSRERRLEPFLRHVNRDFHGDTDGEAEKAAIAVFRLLVARLDRAEVYKIVNVFPHELRPLWPQQVREGHLEPLAKL